LQPQWILGTVSAMDSHRPVLLGVRFAFLLLLLLLVCSGCRRAKSNALDAGQGSGPHPDARAPDSAPTKVSPLNLKLSCETPVVAAGEDIRLRLEIANESPQDIQIDDASLTDYAEMRDTNGAAIPQWLVMDIYLVGLRGKEALWTLAAGGSKTITLDYPFRHGAWHASGAPGGRYEGYAIEVHRPEGSAMHAIHKVPGRVSIVMHWLAEAETVQWRARQLDVAPGWWGEVASNPVEIRLVPAPTRVVR
jgi:hypothetical protein